MKLKGCSSCNPSFINREFCHEEGCPDHWKDENGVAYPVNCRNCEGLFIPDSDYERYCSIECFSESYGLDTGHIDETAYDEY